MDEFWASLDGNPLVRWGVKSACATMRGVQPVYLATPYTRRAMIGAAYSRGAATVVTLEALSVLRIMTLARISAISPIVQAHAVICDMMQDADGRAGEKQVADFALDAVFWARWCAPLLRACRAVHVPALAGWSDSDGIRHEVQTALQANVPVFMGAACPARKEAS